MVFYDGEELRRSLDKLLGKHGLTCTIDVTVVQAVMDTFRHHKEFTRRFCEAFCSHLAETQFDQPRIELRHFAGYVDELHTGDTKHTGRDALRATLEEVVCFEERLVLQAMLDKYHDLPQDDREGFRIDSVEFRRHPTLSAKLSEYQRVTGAVEGEDVEVECRILLQRLTAKGIIRVCGGESEDAWCWEVPV